MSEGEQELFRVRRIIDGAYLQARATCSDSLRLKWGRQLPKPVQRVRALAVANAMIALTGDTGIEIEPAE